MYRLLRSVLFSLDPEWVHERAIGAIAAGLVHAPAPPSGLQVEVCGLRFPNPLGLAAGFDKNAVAVSRWAGLGFGFVEVGTITWHPQPGNPKPRLFRLPESEAVINRMGFNNDGAVRVADRLRRASSSIPVGVNLGKSKVTEPKDAPEDYAKSFRVLRDLGDYFVVNVSSPNTPGLRDLQDRGPLGEIFAALGEVQSGKPMFVKVAPDLGPEALDDVLAVAEEHRLAGIVATNTTIRRDMLRSDPGQAGGLSGRPLRERSDEVLAYLARGKRPEMALIGVGGVFNGEDVYRKIALGADLVQVYTGWVYGGPGMAVRSLQELAAKMAREGIKSLAELKGSAV